MSNEIGGAFWSYESSENNQISWWEECGEDRCYTLSGRTALDYIVKDIKAKHQEVSSVYMPSYCCDSMIFPFVKNGIKVKFYTVKRAENGLDIEYDYDNKCDIIFVMEYFGFSQKNLQNIVGKESKNGKIVLQDVTHSLFNKMPILEGVTYGFASFRKWTNVFAGIAISMQDKFEAGLTGKNDKLMDLHNEASADKCKYMDGNSESKQYLEKFAELEELLDEEYVEYSVDENELKKLKKLDIKYISNRRKENAYAVVTKLKKLLPEVLIYKDFSDGDVPLFVPIMLKEDERLRVREALKKKNIFCPIHWPLTHYHSIEDENALKLYDCEMSIVCDQRNDVEEMYREIGALYECICNCRGRG